jgi:hypothetical protein
MEKDPARADASDAYATCDDLGEPLPPGTLPTDQQREPDRAAAHRGTAGGSTDFADDDEREFERAGLVRDEERPPVDPMAPGRAVAESSTDDVPEPNEPA